MISHEALREFIEIWEEKTGNKISRELALERAVQLLAIINATFRPIKKEWLPIKNERKNITENQPASAQL